MIRNLWLFAVSLVLLVVAFGFSIERLWFVRNAETTLGQVVHVDGYNTYCGGGRRRRSYSCTKYKVDVQFYHMNSRHVFTLPAGNSRGSNQPESLSKYRIGDSLPVIYSPNNPSKAYLNTTFGVWGVPIMLFFSQIATFFASFLPSRRRG